MKDAARGCVAAANDWQWLFGAPLLGAIVYVVNHWVGEGALTFSQDTVIGVLVAAFIAFVLTWVVVFLIKFFNAPSKLFCELKDRSESEISALKLAIANKEARQSAMMRLWELRKEGVELRNQSITALNFENWKQKYENWHAEVMGFAQTVSPNMRAWIETLDRVRPPPRLPAAANNEHELLRNCLSEILLRMQEFLQAEMLHRDIEEFQT